MDRKQLASANLINFIRIAIALQDAILIKSRQELALALSK